MSLDPARLDLLIRRFVAVANRKGVEEIGPKIRQAFLGTSTDQAALRHEVEAQLLRWVRTNPDGRHADAIPAATALHAYLFPPAGASLLVRALPHREPAELPELARRVGGATWEDRLDVAGSASEGRVEDRTLTTLHRRARASSSQDDLVEALLATDLRALFDAERLAAPRRADRGKSYLQDHDGIPSTGTTTNRGEEHLAIALATRFGVAGAGLAHAHLGAIRIVDYQVPLKARQSDGLGKVDLVGLDEHGRLCVIELKAAGSAEPPVRAVLEGLSYAAILSANLETLVRECADRGLQALPTPPRVLVWAPEAYWRTHRHAVPRLLPLLAQVANQTNVPVSLVSIGDVDVAPGLNGARPGLIGAPSCRVVHHAEPGGRTLRG